MRTFDYEDMGGCSVLPIPQTIYQKAAKYDVIMAVLIETAYLDCDKSQGDRITVSNGMLDRIIRGLEPERCKEKLIKLKELEDERHNQK